MHKRVETIKIYKEQLAMLGTENTSDLLKMLLESDFFDVPASKSHHNNYPGGLADHVLNFSRILHKLCSTLLPASDKLFDFPLEYGSVKPIPFRPLIVAIGHDFNKIGGYSYNKRNVKNESTGNQWKELIGYDTKERSLPSNAYGLNCMTKVISLSEIEEDAIYWAEGAYMTKGDFYLGKFLDKAYVKDIRVYLTHVADMLASQYVEKRLSDVEVDAAIREWGK